MLPGISRSGSTISTALILGVDKEKATRFSFLMVLLPIIGAMLLKLKDYFEEPAVAGGISAAVLTIGFFAAFISGLFACTWMIKIVKKVGMNLVISLGKKIFTTIFCDTFSKSIFAILFLKVFLRYFF